MAVIIVYGHRYYGRVDRVAGLFHFATLFFHVSYLPLYPVQTCLIRESAGGGWGNSGPSVGLQLKSVLVGYLRGWLSKFCGFLAFAGGLLCGVAVFPLSNPASTILAISLAIGIGFAHLYVLTEEPRGHRHPAAERLLLQIALTVLTLAVGGGQLLVAGVVVGMVDAKAGQMLHVLPPVACALLAAAQIPGYGYRLSLLLTPAGDERGQNLAAEFGVSRRLSQRR